MSKQRQIYKQEHIYSVAQRLAIHLVRRFDGNAAGDNKTDSRKQNIKKQYLDDIYAI